MGTDYRVTPRSDDDVTRLANNLLVYFGASNRFPVNVISLVQRPNIWTVTGEKKLEFLAVPDEQLEDDAVTTYSPGSVRITARQSVFTRAKMGVGRDRMTLAHELGHAVMHDGPPMARGLGAVGKSPVSWIKTYESAEHQAKVFGSRLLIIDELAEDAVDAEDVSTRFGISLEAAAIYYRKLDERRHRSLHAANIERMADEFRISVQPFSVTTRYLDASCPGCGGRRVLPLGVKFECQDCNLMGDMPDGDTAG